jgi:gliding motility-associated-like protein
LKTTLTSGARKPLLIFLLFISLNSFGQSPLSTVGTDFWMGFMTNRGFQNDPQCQLIITSETSTTGLVEMPLQSWSQSFTVTPGAATIVIMPHFNNAPQSSAEHLSSGVIESLGVHITAVDSVSVFAVNYGSNQHDIMKVLPVQSLGTEYIVSSFPGEGHSFSPNGDESNDNLHIKHECIFDDFEFRIYNRWGEVIFTAYDPDFIWQGTNGLGELVQFGTYVWKARYRLADDIERVHVKERTGHINVIR